MTTIAEPVPARVVATAARRRRGRRSLLVRAARTRRGAIGLTIAGAVVLVAVVGPAFAPHSPTEFIGVPFAKPGGDGRFGTDTLGRDVLSRVVRGGWLILLMAALSTVLAVGIGCTAGALAGYVRGRWDAVIMRVADIMLAFPSLVLVLVLVSVLGPRMWLIVLATGLGSAPAVARVIRAATIAVAERDYVRAVELQGVRRRTIIRTEVLPGLVNPMMVEAGLRLTWSILAIAGLAFLGFGQAPPSPDWGIMIRENLIGVQSNAWSVILPAAMIAALSVGTNMYAEAVARVSTRIDGRSDEVVALAVAERVA